VTTLLAQDDVLALLEDGPHATTELAGWCDVPLARMAERLAQLASRGLVKRHSESGRWMRVRLKPDVPVAPLAAVLEQLAFAPKAPTEIGRALSVSRSAVERALAQLQGTGQVKPIGQGSNAKWALASWTAGMARKVAPVTKRTPAIPRAPLPDGELPPANEQTGVVYGKHTKRATKVDAQGVSWWVAGAAPEAPREQFIQLAKARDVEMATDPQWSRPSLAKPLAHVGIRE
jgi:predicted transcriptional regulator